jgi:hypothetical protein
MTYLDCRNRNFGSQTRGNTTRTFQLETRNLKSETYVVPFHPEIFEPYDRLIEITLLGEKKLVPENNSILRCLQYLDMEKISEAELCWNGECIDCQVWIKSGDKEKALMSCRTNAVEGMEIVRLADALQ